MQVKDLKPGDMLDLENLRIKGATGIGAQCEFAVVEEFDGGTRLYTDTVNLTVTPETELLRAGDGYTFAAPETVASWQW